MKKHPILLHSNIYFWKSPKILKNIYKRRPKQTTLYIYRITIYSINKLTNLYPKSIMHINWMRWAWDYLLYLGHLL